MKSFEFWRRKQSRPYRLVLWHTHFPDRFISPQRLPKGQPLPPDCTANLIEKQIEAVAKNFNPEEPILLADDSFVFTDDFEIEPYIEQATRPDAGAVLIGNALLLGPAAQRIFAGLDADPNLDRFEKDWTEADFLEWAGRTNWIFASTYEEKAPHEYVVLGKTNTEPIDLYKATMFILRNGYVEMFYNTPFMSCELGNRRYWTYSSYDLLNRTLEGDLKKYQ